MAVSINTATFTDLSTIEVVFAGGLVKASTIDEIGDWYYMQTPVGSPPYYIPIDVILPGGANVGSATLKVHPQAIPGVEYNITCANAQDSTGVPLLPGNRTKDVTAGLALDPSDPGFPDGLLSALLNACGQQINALSGIPMTRLVKDLETSDVVAFVESLIGFPSGDLRTGNGGAFWCDGYRFTYLIANAPDGGTMALVQSDTYRDRAIPAGTVVTLDISTAEPE